MGMMIQRSMPRSFISHTTRQLVKMHTARHKVSGRPLWRVVLHSATTTARRQAAAEEREAVAAAKEMETARLRALQQKATDHKSELDELRARR